MIAERPIAAILAAALAAAASGCGRAAAPKLSDLSDVPQAAAVARRDLPLTAPAYGIAVQGAAGQEFEATVEAADAGKVRSGQQALAYVLPSTAPISCRVERVMRDASAETGQALVWLKPSSADPAPENDFIFARILIGTHRGALTVPRGAVMIRGGKTMVVRLGRSADGKTVYEPIPVAIGLTAGGYAEVLSGLAPGDSVVAAAGIGLLDPAFKAEGGD
ncbi:MAG: hypothetical protein KGL74_12970 [Elusimicrobia bacterium]|nr:hypothetical protein [Elusimicrobiota bacterium]